MWKTILVLSSFLVLVGAAKAPSPAPTNFLPVPMTRQSTEYSCGPAALLGVLGYYGITDFNETYLMKAAETNKEGTEISALVRVAKEAGLKAEWHENVELEAIQKSLRSGNPVLVAAQAWPDVSRPSFSEDWEDGHYVVIVALDDEYIYFMDPSHLGSRGYWSIESFLDRWHDLNEGNVRSNHLAIFFEGTPKPPESWLPTP